MADIKIRLKNNFEFTAEAVSENQDILGKTGFLMINVPFSASVSAVVQSNLTKENMETVTVWKDGVQTAVFSGFTDAIFVSVNISGETAVLTVNAQKKI